MQLALETEILLKLALAIGESPSLEPMLRHFLSEFVRLVNGSGAKVVAVRGPGGSVDAVATPVAAVPRILRLQERYRAFHEAWPHERTWARLSSRPSDEPLHVELEDAHVHAFLLPDYGFLLLFKNGAPLSVGFQRAFAGVARKLALAARGAIAEEELRRQTQRLDLATDAASIGVWEFEPATGRLTWDARMFSLFDVDPDEFSGELDDFMRCLHPEDRPRIGAAFTDAMDRGDRFAFAFRIVDRTGAVRHVRAAGRIQRDDRGTPVRIAGVNLDVSAERLAEEEMRRARDLAEAASEAKSRFIANMSHELRTPLNGMIGMTELALQAGVAEPQRGYLEVARTSAESLLLLVNDILDYATVDAGGITLSSVPFDITELATSTLKALGPRASRKGIALVLDIAPDLPAVSLGDPERLRQVLNNLCDNAIKFTEAGEVVVTVRRLPVAAGPADRLEVSVRDTGIGIAPAMQAVVFEAFRQADSSVTRRFGGTGLGLSIARQLIQRMGGRLMLESAPGAGSTFRVVVDLARAEAGTPTAPAIQPALSGWHVLVAEANAATRDVIGRVLRHHGATIREVADGAGVLDAAGAASPPDAIILDAALEDGRDGERVVLQLSAAHPALLARTVLLQTAHGGDSAVHPLTSRVAGELMRPVAPGELLAALAAIGHPSDVVPIDSGTPAVPDARGIGVDGSVDRRPTGVRVLVVEDNPVNQQVAAAMLRSLGHEVAIACDGQEAVEALAAAHYDLVFMDMQMPVLDGLAATRVIRAREGGGARVPIIAMTASAMPEERDACLAAGMDEHLAKPVRLAQVREVLLRFAARDAAA